MKKIVVTWNVGCHEWVSKSSDFTEKQSHWKFYKIHIRVARWFVSNQKSKFGKKFSGLQIVKCSCIIWPFGIFYGYLGYFMTIRYILCSIGTIFAVLVSCTKKNLETLIHRQLIGTKLVGIKVLAENGNCIKTWSLKKIDYTQLQCKDSEKIAAVKKTFVLFFFFL
jgi:hypothetical protein